jgi:hypothetical protein
MSYVYFVLDEKSNAVKIGKANVIDTRLTDLQIGNPNPLQVIHHIKCDSEEDSFMKERYFHNMFEDLHIRGEWFQYDQSMFDELILENFVSNVKPKRKPLILNTLYGTEYKFDIKDRPRCFFYPNLPVQILDNFESSDKRKVPYRTMEYPTQGIKALAPFSYELDRVLISSKKHRENMLLARYEKSKQEKNQSRSLLEFL